MIGVKVHLAKIIQTAREINGEFLPIDTNGLGGGRLDHVVIVDDHAYKLSTEAHARALFEQLVGGAEGGK